MQDSTVISTFTSHADADEAVKELNRNGFDMTKLSVVGKGYHSEEHAIGFYSVGDRIRSWGATGAFWGGIWGLLLAPAVFLVPGLGLVGLAGPVVAAVVSALEGAVIGGGVTALGAALAELGVPKDDAVKYETAIRANGFLLIVHGTSEDVEQARAILNRTAVTTEAGSAPAV
ncbi:putative membrane protein [Paraburkholderia sp. GAS199]|uniref:general stress protein n=1 Tax=Paraburkholderia sp. GAS199 TaxID=3035126 RepID=UPI003D23D2CD